MCRQPPVTVPVVPAVPGNVSSSGEFVKQKVWESFPAYYRLATSHEAKSSETALHEVMPNWEIAYLADGSVGGAQYGDSTTYVLLPCITLLTAFVQHRCLSACLRMHVNALTALPTCGIMLYSTLCCLPSSQALYMPSAMECSHSCQQNLDHQQICILCFV